MWKKKVDWTFTGDLLQKNLWVKLFATGPYDPLHDKHCFFCMVCHRNVKLVAPGCYEIKSHFQRNQNLRPDAQYRERLMPKAAQEENVRILYDSILEH